MQIARYSRLYETAPAYVVDQDPFLNAAILLKTQASPEALLSILKEVEVSSAVNFATIFFWSHQSTCTILMV